MGGMISRFKQADSATSFEHWSDLPEGVQALIVAKLPPEDVGRVAAADKRLDRLSQSSPQWVDLLPARGVQRPLPTQPPRQAVGTILTSYSRGRHLQDAVQGMHERGTPLDADRLFEVDLAYWVKKEKQAGNPAAEEAARRIQEARDSQATNLNLCDLPVRTLPQCIGQLAGLQVFDLSGCTGLTELPHTLGQLDRLQGLNLSGCTSLTELPHTLGQLVCLQGLGLNNCTGLKQLPDVLAKLAGLEQLGLNGCTGLKQLPDGLAQLVHLKQLGLSDCTGLKQLPNGLAQLVRLEQLGLNGCTGLKQLPNGLAQWVHLEQLGLSGCTGLKQLPDGLAQWVRLQGLDLSGCTSLKQLPDGLAQWVRLEKLYLSGCTGLRDKALPAGLIKPSLQIYH